MEDMIRIEDLVFEYTRDEDQQPVSAIQNVSLNIEKGSFTAIIGRNGSGKSTLAKILTPCCFQAAGLFMLTDSIPEKKSRSGIFGRVRRWFSKTRITRLFPLLWRTM